ncbi:type VII toxin-antitoxin system HepT family RNase toxin [Geopseudomonas aromaticivorans]
MIDDLLSLKAATIERGVKRAREEYARDPATFASDLSRQDAAILNIQRACEAALDMGQHLIRREHLGVPQSARNRAHAPAWARSPAAPAARREASIARAPTQERGSHQKPALQI